MITDKYPKYYVRVICTSHPKWHYTGHSSCFKCLTYMKYWMYILMMYARNESGKIELCRTDRDNGYTYRNTVIKEYAVEEVTV